MSTDSTAILLARLDVYGKMTKALLMHQGLYQVIDCWAQGANEGGRYVSLFSSRAQFRICAVYEEHFHKLPKFITDQLQAESVEIPTERERCAKKGILRSCPNFAITRWQLGSGDDKEKWRFGDVLWVSEAQSQANRSGGQEEQGPAGQPAQPGQPKQSARPDSASARLAAHIEFLFSAKNAEDATKWLVERYCAAQTPDNLRTSLDQLSESECRLVYDTLVAKGDFYLRAWKKERAGRV